MVNILVCGIDYEEGRNYSNDPTSNDGMTDMILYVQFDIKNGALRMLQIPRNSLVTTKNKKITLSNGKTYAARIIRSTRWQSPMAAASPLWPMSSMISSDCPSITM